MVQVFRGRAATPEADAERTAALLDAAAEGLRGVRVWRPHRQVAFGRRDAAAEGFTGAKRAARERGFPPYERSVGGRAVAYTGTTVAFAHAVPIDDMRRGMDARYEAATGTVAGALADLGVDADRGEPPDSFCPGDHSLSAGGKLVGIAQRVTREAALVSGVVVTRDRWEIAEVLEPVYDALDVPFDPASVGSVAAAGGPNDPDAVVDALERALVGDAGDVRIVDVGA